jgi:hypothetical protein
MIQVHILELFASPDISESSLGKCLLFLGGPPVAPIFMLIFGYFIARSKKTSGELIVRGLKIFGLGMLLNLALNFNLILSVLNGKLQLSIWPYVFGVDILHFAGLALIFIGVFRKMIEKRMIISFSTIILIVVAGHLLSKFSPENTSLKFIASYFYGCSEWSYFPLLPWLAYPLAGMIFYRLSNKNELSILQKPAIKISAGLVFLAVIALTITFAIGISSNLPAYYHHGILFFMWTIFFAAGYCLFANELDKLTGNSFVLKYIKWLGKNVTLIYFIQWIIIGNIATEIYRTVSERSNLLVYFVLILTASSLIALLIVKLSEKFFPAKQ